MDDAELLDIMVTMVSDLRMSVSQNSELAKRNVADSKGIQRANAEGQVQAFIFAYNKLDEILKTVKELGMKPSTIHETTAVNRQWNVMRISDEVWVSDFYDKRETAQAACDSMNERAGEIKYKVVEQ